MSKYRKPVIVLALAGAAVLGVAGTATAFALNGSSQAAGGTVWCGADDLNIHAYDAHSPNGGAKLFRIAFTAKDGVTCEIGGSLSNVHFLDASGRDMKVPLGVGPAAEYVEVPVDAAHEAAVYVTSQSEGPRVNPAAVQFNLPGKGSLSAAVTVAWPSGLGALVQVTDLMAPVS